MGCMETMQLTLPAFGKLELGRTTLDLPPGLEFKDWKELGRRLGELRQSAMFWVGDWWIYGEHAYGDRRALVEADDWQGPSFETCKNAGSVCRAFSERSRRRDRLTFSHHAAVAALPPEQQNRLLDWAEETIAATGKPRPVSQLREFARRQRLSGGLIGNVLPPGALPVGEAKPLLSESSLAVIEAIGKQPSPPPAGGEPQPLTPVVVQENRPPRTISLLVSEPAPLVAPVELVARAGAKPPPTAEITAPQFTVPVGPSRPAPVEPDLAAAKSLRGALIYFTWSAESQIDLQAAGRGLSMDEREKVRQQLQTAAQSWGSIFSTSPLSSRRSNSCPGVWQFNGPPTVARFLATRSSTTQQLMPQS